MVADIQIQFIDSIRAYCPGSIVSGNVLLNISSSKTINKITLKLIGKGSVRFNPLGEEMQMPRTLSGKEEYINDEKILWQPPEFKSPDTMYIPRHFPFSFKLPENCPPTFFSNSAKIYYKLIATVDIPWAIDPTVDETINVVPALINFNLMPFLGIVKNQTKEHGNFKVNITIPRSAYRLGEIIPMNIEITNHTAESSVTIVTHIKSIKSYRGSRRYEMDLFYQHQEITKSSAKKYEANGGEFLARPGCVSVFLRQIRIPNDMYPSFSGHYIVKMEYLLCARIITSSDCMKFYFPITLSQFDAIQPQNPGMINSPESLGVISFFLNIFSLYYFFIFKCCNKSAFS